MFNRKPKITVPGGELPKPQGIQPAGPEYDGLPVEDKVEVDPEFDLRLDLETVDHEIEPEQENFADLDRELMSDDEDSDHDEDADERREEHLRRKKNDKIFNNSYNTGEGYDTEENSYRSDIRISASYSESHLHDPDKYRDHLDQSVTQRDIILFVDQCKEIQDILSIDPSRKKYSKPEINFMFSKIKQGLESGFSKSSFISYIYILDAISSITTLEYKKLFDVLEYEHKECLLMELNQKYKILDQNHKSKKLF